MCPVSHRATDRKVSTSQLPASGSQGSTSGRLYIFAVAQIAASFVLLGSEHAARHSSRCKWREPAFIRQMLDMNVLFMSFVQQAARANRQLLQRVHPANPPAPPV